MGTAWRHYWIALVLLAAALPLPALMSTQSETPLRQPLDSVPFEIGGWHGWDEHLDGRVRAKLGTADVLMREYSDASGAPIALYVSYFPQQHNGAQSHSPQNCLPGAGWQPVLARRVPYPLGDTGKSSINEIVYEKNGRRQLVLYWFRERERIVASEYLVKLYLVWDALTRKRTDGALVRISAPIGDSEETVRRRCLDFMRVALPRLEEFFPS